MSSSMRLAAVAEARRLDRDSGEGAAELVDDDRRERLALDVVGHDQQRPARLDHGLEHREEVLDGPTFTSPISRSRAEIVATGAMSSLPPMFFDCLFRSSTTAWTACSIPRFSAIGLAPAAKRPR